MMKNDPPQPAPAPPPPKEETKVTEPEVVKETTDEPPTVVEAPKPKKTEAPRKKVEPPKKIEPPKKVEKPLKLEPVKEEPKPVKEDPKPSGPPGMASIDVASGYAIIYIDGKKYGETPLVTKLSPGKHSVRAVSPSGATRTSSITIESGKTAVQRLEW
jgi:outer membrane biosynthesis protein TonB